MAQQNEVEYAIYAIPDPNKSLKEFGSSLKHNQSILKWKYPHITMTSFIPNSIKNKMEISLVSLLKNVNVNNWKPSDIVVHKGKNLVKLHVKSRTLNELSKYFGSTGLNVKRDFHITLGTVGEMKFMSSMDLENIKKYLAGLDWFLVIAKKEDNCVNVKTDFMVKM